MHTPLRSRIGARELLVGTVVTLPDVALAELSASAFDFVWIDMEHGALGCAEVQPLAIAARAARAASFARVRHADDGAIGALLDAGVDGIVVPRVNGASAAARAVERLSHPPAGSRGFAARRATDYGRRTGRRPRPLCMVQVESAAAVDDAEAIAAVDGVDVLVVGCADLALSLGGEMDPRSADFRAAVTHVQEVAEAAGIASGIAGPDDPALLAELAAGRSTVLVLAADVRIYARALDNATEKLRGGLALRASEREESHVSA
jgi:2-keto-3-deoxy-L-rhamnonate aldolase RhmA